MKTVRNCCRMTIGSTTKFAKGFKNYETLKKQRKQTLNFFNNNLKKIFSHQIGLKLTKMFK